MQIEAAYQRKGLGSFMMKALEQMVIHYKLEKVVLTILKNNEDATKFYKNLGYGIDESSPDKSDGVGYEIMRKTFI